MPGKGKNILFQFVRLGLSQYGQDDIFQIRGGYNGKSKLICTLQSRNMALPKTK